MTQQAAKKKLLKRSVFWGTVVVLSWPFVHWLGGGSSTEKKLDYSKPIYTQDRAIVCPQSVFFDQRADHGPDAVDDLFLFGKTENAEALGCERWMGGIPVHAQRMDRPFDPYVAIYPAGNSSVALFTVEAYLTNDGSTDANETNNQPLTQEEKAEQAAAKKQELIATSAPDSDTMNKESYEADRTEFQRRLPTLEKPGPNLRWYPNPQVKGPDNQEMSDLVTPYGPCILFAGNTKAGYSSLAIDANPYRPPVKPIILGTYPLRAQAVLAAVDYCANWYRNVRQQPPDPLREQHLWFPPDSDPTEEKQPFADSSAASSTTSNVPDQQQAAPIVRVEPMTWNLQPNGDEVLTGPSGACATLALLSAHDPYKVHLIFKDGTLEIFDVQDTEKAQQAAVARCQPQS